jgi:ssDNA-binding Zn-finger/Zn-ribbon topoisomerase 1
MSNHFTCPACESYLIKQRNRCGQYFWFCSNKKYCSLQLGAYGEDNRPEYPPVIYRCECSQGILLHYTSVYGKYWKCSQSKKGCLKKYKDKWGCPIMPFRVRFV